MLQKSKAIMRQAPLLLPHAVILIVFASLSQKSTMTTDLRCHIHAFVLIPPLSIKKDYHRLDEDCYFNPTPETSKSCLSLDATTRRQSFGDLLGSTLALPVMVDSVANIQPAEAADDYPFKVRTCNKFFYDPIVPQVFIL